MAINKLLNGQSNYDISMKLYGNLDMLVALAVDSEVADLGVEVSSYNYDEKSSNINNNFIGYNYATKYNQFVEASSTGYDHDDYDPTEYE